MGGSLKKIVAGIPFLLIFTRLSVCAGMFPAADVPDGGPLAETLAVNLDSLLMEMRACFACNPIADPWHKLCPKVTFQCVKSDSGITVNQTFDKSKLSISYRQACSVRDKAFKVSLTFNDKEARAKLCRFCRELRRLSQAGVRTRRYVTDDFEQLNVRSADPSLQAGIARFTADFPGRFGLIKQPDLEGVREPVAVKKAQPRFPTFPFKNGENRITGRVTVAVLVDTTGKVEQVKLLESSNAYFNSEAVRAVKQWVFKPAAYRGKKIKFWHNQSVHFQAE